MQPMDLLKSPRATNFAALVQPIHLLRTPAAPGSTTQFAGCSRYNVKEVKESAARLQAMLPPVKQNEKPHVTELGVQTPHISERTETRETFYSSSRSASTRPIAKHHRSLLFFQWSQHMAKDEWSRDVQTALYKLLTPIKMVLSDTFLDESVKSLKGQQFLAALNEHPEYQRLLQLCRDHPPSANPRAQALLLQCCTESVLGVVKSSEVIRNARTCSDANFCFHRGRDGGMWFSAYAASFHSAHANTNLAFDAATAAALVNDAYDRPKDRRSGQPSIFDFHHDEREALQYVATYWSDTYTAATPDLREWMDAFKAWQMDPSVQCNTGYREGWYQEVQEAVFSCSV